MLTATPPDVPAFQSSAGGHILTAGASESAFNEKPNRLRLATATAKGRAGKQNSKKTKRHGFFTCTSGVCHAAVLCSGQTSATTRAGLQIELGSDHTVAPDEQMKANKEKQENLKIQRSEETREKATTPVTLTNRSKPGRWMRDGSRVGGGRSQPTKSFMRAGVMWRVRKSDRGTTGPSSTG